MRPAGPDPSPPAGQGLAALALLATQLLFGLHYSVAREITAHLDPLAWTALRGLLAAGALALLMLARRRPWPRERATWRRLWLLGLLGVALNQLLFNAGMARSTAIHGALLVATLPALTLAFAVLLRHEALTRRKLASVLLGLVGVGVLMRVDAVAGAGAWWTDRGGGPAAGFTDTLLFGDLLIFLNTISYALFLTLGKATTRALPALTLGAGVFATGGAMVALVGGPALLAADLAALPGELWAMMAFVVLGPTVVAYLLNLFALARLPSSLVGLAVNLQLVVAATTGALWHGEAIEARVVVAGLLVLAALALRSWPGRGPQRTG